MIENPIPWPNDARCAAAFTFDMDAESLLHIYQGETAPNRIALSSMLRYGPEVAIPRIVSAFERYGLRQTFFVPGWCLETYPRAVELILRGGHEIAHHGYIHENPNRLSSQEEAEYLGRAIGSIVKATGRRPRGYRAPSYAFSRYTVDLLIKEGFDYDASLLGHDIPHLIEGERGRLIELPSDVTLDDWTQYVCSKDLGNTMPIQSPERATEVFRAEFDAAWRYGGMWIAVWHPFVSGRLARYDAMIGLIEYMQKKGGVWFARLDEIADHVRSCIDCGRWKPRIDRLPFWQEPLQGVPGGRAVRVG
jgi:peptidoglycan/xylan/chitin deacetylase (PgdA/CDA1 family)